MKNWNSNSDTKGTVTFHGRLNNVMRTVWSAFILLVSMLQGKVYLMCMYLLNLVWCQWKKVLTQTQTQPQTTKTTERKAYQHLFQNKVCDRHFLFMTKRAFTRKRKQQQIYPLFYFKTSKTASILLFFDLFHMFASIRTKKYWLSMWKPNSLKCAPMII